VADTITHDAEGRTFKNGVLQVSSSPEPGPAGAIRAMISALASVFTPAKAIKANPDKINQAVEDASGGSSGALGDQF
jgi:hypothetical protein